MISEIVRDRLFHQIHENRGITETELARAVFGSAAYRQRVRSDCRVLMAEHTVIRQGGGGPADPYRYFSIGMGIRGLVCILRRTGEDDRRARNRERMRAAAIALAGFAGVAGLALAAFWWV